MIWFRYEGEAVGKGRPRVSRQGDVVRTYTPKKTRQFETAFRTEFIARTSEPMPVYKKDTQLEAIIDIGVSIPKSYTKKRQELCRQRKEAPTKKPDIDNIIKSILDALNGYAYEDDSQIVFIVADKHYAEEPYIEVKIDEH